MSSSEFKNRVYGCVVVKAINANYNADFSGLPRRLKSDGSFYATDKSFKWLVRNYIKKNYSDEKVLFTKHFHNKIETDDLKTSYEVLFDTKLKDNSNVKKSDKESVFKNLTEAIDVRLFGATFTPDGAKGNNISIHGNVQINHATDLYKKGRVYTDEILAPFTAIGSMSKATEAHYIHNFSVNPQNLSSWKNTVSDIKTLSNNDISILKNAFNNSATFYDSHSKAGVENELSIYVTLNETSTLTLPSFTQFIKFEKDKEGNNSFDITNLITYLTKYESEIDSIELYYIEELLNVINDSDTLKDKVKIYDLLKVVEVN
ncbi:MAG: type I CRISPR-associated protein Cas7 [Campylobacterota bacterium]|nr:type I CRISPR-associated protein Cas7 [Campylobacterota bacterium]